MDTNLKRSKKFRSFFYRMVAAGALFTMVASAIMGREALFNLKKEGLGTLKGEIYYMTEFREYMSSLYSLAMLGYAGAGDNNGYPLTGENATNIAENAKKKFASAAKELGKDLMYYVEYKGKVVESGNITYPLFSEYDGHLLLPADAVLYCYWDGDPQTEVFFPSGNDLTTINPSAYYAQQYKPNTEGTNRIYMFLAIREDGQFNSHTLRHLNLYAKYYQFVLYLFLGSAALAFISLLACLFSIKAARAAKEDYQKLSAKVFLEVKVAAVIAWGYFSTVYGLWNFGDLLGWRAYSAYYNLMLYFPTGILLYLLWADLRSNGLDFFKHSFIYTARCRIKDAVKEFLDAYPWKKRMMAVHYFTLFLAILPLLVGGRMIFQYFSYYTRLNIFSATGIFLLLLGMLLVFISFRFKRLIWDTADMVTKISAIRSGNAGAPLILKETSMLRYAAADLNSIEKGMEAAIEQNNRSNKMRVELITNVSHDLKTPLTSIINYADLLCEEPLAEPASQYADALRSKAYRLKGMVQDVFELSKASSGNLPVEKTQLDLAKLVRQTLADMDEKIQESGLTFKLSISEEPMMIMADGDKLYRVFQNLIINALQYSLENSRVHVQLTHEGDFAFARIKNISKEELNFSPTEITERFVRADASRTTEGSGLGLSIAKSFTEACGGTFTVELDADLFTACVRFPL